MARTLSTRISVQIAALLADTLDLSTVRDNLEKIFTTEIPTGSSSGQANQVWHDARTIADGATDSLDLAGALTNAIGQTVTFSSIKAVIIKFASGNTTAVAVTRPASNGVPIFSAASDAVPFAANGLFAWVNPGAGITVTAGTGDLFNLVNAAGAAANYEINVIGVQ